MKAVAVYPGKPNSMHLEEVPKPKVTDVPDGRGVLVKVLRVGVDGTDKEINAAEYGQAPPGDDFLITGHESFGQVVEVGPNVPSSLRRGTYVVATVRRPGSSVYDRIGMQDMTTDDVYYERGINLRHGYLTEYYVEDAQWVVPLPESLREVGVLLEPLTVAEKGINQAFEIQRRLRIWRPGRAAVLGAGTIGLLATLALRLRGIEAVCYSLRRPPYLNSELVEALGARYVSAMDVSLAEAAAEHGPFDIVFEATGFSPLVFDAAEALGKNGVLVLASVTGGERKAEVNADRINQGFVLGNKVMVGTVNASRDDFVRGVDDLVKAEALYPGWLGRLLTTPVRGLENYAEMLRRLTDDEDAIKVFVEVARPEPVTKAVAAETVRPTASEGVLPMAEQFDVVILGAGPAGEVALNTLAKAGKRLALVEQELIGGECSNWGCIPSKTLLRPPELKGQSMRTAGVSTPALDWPQLSAYRDYMVSNHDDARKIARYEERGITVVKEQGRIAGPGRVEANGRVLEADAIVVATGAEAVIPTIPGLKEAGYWTNREATELTEIPESAVFIGGGVVAIELSQFLARFGSRVTIVGPRLATREEPRVGELLRGILEEDGIDLRLGPRAVGVHRENGNRVVELDNGDRVAGEVVVVATGRRPRTSDIGLETVGIEPGPRGIEIDERCRAADGVWAIGDVTGVAMFTHVGKYQARVAAADICGLPAKADYRAVPRVIFTDPEVASVGLSEADARDVGIDVVAATIDLPTSIARPYTFQEHPRGTFGIVVDRDRQVLVGGWAVAPLASEWIHTAVLAIRAEIPVAVLKDTIAQFPTFSEAFGAALRALPEEAMLMPADHCAHPMIAEPTTEVRA